jgi:hypothetical protein
MVLIVNSRRDSQVYTVAGRDTKLTKPELKGAFERNIDHFKSRQFGTGLEGMIEMIISAYNNAHIMQVSSGSAVQQQK